MYTERCSVILEMQRPNKIVSRRFPKSARETRSAIAVSWSQPIIIYWSEQLIDQIMIHIDSTTIITTMISLICAPAPV